MNKKRADYLVDYCKEMEIRLDQAIKDGKLLVDIQAIKQLFGINREILNHVRQNMDCG